MTQTKCHCHHGASYAACCQPYHQGEVIPPSAEALMRSRYSAFCCQNKDYLLSTWHTETVPEDLNLEEEPGEWVRLEVIEADEDEQEGEAEVEFKAYLIHQDKLEILHERSVFLLEGGKWLYHSGEFLNEGAPVSKIKKSEPCPCGSGKKYKNCQHRCSNNKS